MKQTLSLILLCALLLSLFSACASGTGGSEETAPGVSGGASSSATPADGSGAEAEE